MLDRCLSASLAPAEWVYALGVFVRNRAFDWGLLASRPGSIPTLAIGNLTVGGTGKTPVSAWFAHALHELGHRPAIVMRGYGGDELEVHRVLNPSVPAVAAADRVAGVERAGDGGADLAVLDDAFQHRSLRASRSIVLIAAEQWSESPRLLPRGPWREKPGAAARATLAVITRKTASHEESKRVGEEIARRMPGRPQARAHITLKGLARYSQAGCLETPEQMRGLDCALAVAGVARPETVWAQLEDSGISVRKRLSFPDHNRYSSAEIDQIRRGCAGSPLVATLKDAVKLGPALAGELDIYVPVQGVIWEAGFEEVESLIASLAREVERAGRSQR